MAKFCIASPHKDEMWYDYRLYINLRNTLEKMGHTYQAGSKNRIYFLGGPQRLHYPTVGKFDNDANNIALIYCHAQKLQRINLFDHVFVPSQQVKDYFVKKKWKERFTSRTQRKFTTRREIEIIRPFSSLSPTDQKQQKFVCDIAFMGTPRVRPIVEAVLSIVEKHKLDLKIIGPSWGAYPGNPAAKKYCIAKSLPYEDIPLLANSAKIHLNDHHHSMNQFAAVSHKYVDMISAGGFVICDNNQDAKKYYQGETFTDEASLEDLILHYLGDDEARKQKQLEQYQIVKQQTTIQAAHCLARYFLV